MPVINGVYLKDFTALPGAVADANIIPIAISGNQIAYRTTVAGIITNARITGKLLTGLSITGGAVVAADTILQAFGKVQNQINGINLALYVPYTGATGAVNLGAYDLTVNGIKVGIGAGSINTNTIVGASALNANTTGGLNTAIGRFALTANTEGDFNTAVGASSLIANTTGSSNSAFGYVSLNANTTGTLNAALGNLALTNNTTGAYNSGIGYSALAGNTTGSNNVGVGYIAGYLVNAGTDNITSGTSVYIGSDTRASASGNQNEIVIGYEGRGNGSNTVTIGNSSIANNYFIGNIRGGAFIKLGGTSAQFLKADGTVDSVSYGTGSVTSVGLSMPSAFSVASSPITTSGTIAVTGAGLASQYIRGDGALSDFPTTGGGGSSVSYYLNGSVSQGTFVGNTYYEMNKTPVIGAGTDFSIGADGYIAQFITDANDPASLLIPGGNWNVEMYFSASSNGGTPSFYVEVYKYNGTTFTLLGSSSATPEGITNGTAIDIYYTSVGIPETVLTLTDRIAIRVYVTHSGRTITLHTEDNHLSEIVTTFSNGLTALNGLTKQVQYLAVGTAGTDFAISSSVDTHTFNIPDAGASARGLITTGTQTIAGFKTFSSTIKLTNGTSNGFSLESGTTGFYSSLKAPTGLAADIIVTLPSATGTLALTSDLSSYLPLAGGTLTGALSGTSATFSSTLASTGELSTSSGLIAISGSGSNPPTGGVGFRKVSGSLFIYPDSTSLRIRNNANTVDNLTITEAGAATFSSSVTATQGNFINAASTFPLTIDNSTQGYVAQVFKSNNVAFGYIGNANTLNSGGSVTDMVIRSENALILSSASLPRLTIASTGAATFSGNLSCSGASIQLNQTEIFPSSGASNRAYAFNLGNVAAGDFSISQGSSATGGTYTTRLIISPTGEATFNAATAITGNVKINSTDAQGANIGAVLTIGGNINNSGQTDTPFAFISGRKTNSTVSNDDGYMALGTRSSTIGTGTNYWQYISTSGAIRFLAYGAGALTTDASGNITAASDERMKNISGFYTTGLSAIKEIKPITFKWKEETELDTEEFYTGFSAQNMHKAIPESAGKMSNGDLTIQDRPIMATMVNAINELNIKIQELSAEIDLLKGIAPIEPTDNNLE